MAEEGVSAIECWVVLTPSEHARLHAEHAISPSLFEHATSPTFWWLFQTKEDAMQFAIRNFTKHATSPSMLLTSPWTTWFPVKLTFSQALWTQMTTTCDPSEPSIVRLWWKGFQVSGTLPLDNIPFAVLV